MSTIYNGTINDALAARDIASVRAFGLATDISRATDSLSSVSGVAIHTTSTASVTLTYHFKPGGLVSDTVKARDQVSIKSIYTGVINDTGVGRSHLRPTQVVVIAVSGSITDTLNNVTSIVVQDRAVARGGPSALGAYHLTLGDISHATDALSDVWALTHTDSVSAHDALTRMYVGLATHDDQIYAQDYTVTPRIFRQAIQDEADADDALTVRAIYDGVLDDYLTASEFYSPDDSVTSWALNTRTNALTEYRNWNFNSFASMGRKYIGANANGLYELDGARDDPSSNIVADLAGGQVKFNGSKFAGLKGVYLGMNAQGNFLLNLVAGDGRSYTYQFAANPNLMTSKVVIGKGLRSRYFQWELTSTGPDFDLDEIEFVPMVSDRRV